MWQQMLIFTHENSAKLQITENVSVLFFSFCPFAVRTAAKLYPLSHSLLYIENQEVLSLINSFSHKSKSPSWQMVQRKVIISTFFHRVSGHLVKLSAYSLSSMSCIFFSFHYIKVPQTKNYSSRCDSWLLECVKCFKYLLSI